MLGTRSKGWRLHFGRCYLHEVSEVFCWGLKVPCDATWVLLKKVKNSFFSEPQIEKRRLSWLRRDIMSLFYLVLWSRAGVFRVRDIMALFYLVLWSRAGVFRVRDIRALFSLVLCSGLRIHVGVGSSQAGLCHTLITSWKRWRRETAMVNVPFLSGGYCLQTLWSEGKV